MSIAYTIAFTLLVPFLLVRLYVRGLREPDYSARWRERFGHGLVTYPRGSEPIWIHAVSVGEAVAATPLVEHLRTQYPDIPLYVTTTTATGAETVRRRFGTDVEHRYFPYDLPWVVRRCLRVLRPRLLVLMETELWPNLLDACAARGVPVVVANARLSAKSAQRYARFPRMSGKMLSAITCFAVQGADDRNRFVALGADERSMVMTGSLKFDIELPASVAESGEAVRRFLGVNRAVLMAGSTREGEEEMVLEAAAKLLERHPDLLLVIAPRHPERFDAVAELCERAGFHVARHSQGGSCTPQCRVYLVDTMGELPGFYAASDVAFVGGSFAPRGGHNVLEPAALGVPVIVGPHTFNFSDIVRLLGGAGALVQVRDIGEFVTVADRWLADSDARDAAGRAGTDIVVANRGAAGRLTGAIDDLVDRSRPDTEKTASLAE